MRHGWITSIATATWIALFSLPVAADDNGWKKDNALLPEYCRDWLDTKGRWARWLPKLKEMQPHMSHYCAGIYAETMSKLVVDKRGRERWLGQVVAEMKYVSRVCNESCPFYSELHRRWGHALTAQGKAIEGLEHFRLAESRPQAQVRPN